MSTGRGYRSSRSSRALARSSGALADRVEPEKWIPVAALHDVVREQGRSLDQVDSLRFRVADASGLQRPGFGEQARQRTADPVGQLAALEDDRDRPLREQGRDRVDGRVALEGLQRQLERFALEEYRP